MLSMSLYVWSLLCICFSFRIKVKCFHMINRFAVYSLINIKIWLFFINSVIFLYDLGYAPATSYTSPVIFDFIIIEIFNSFGILFFFIIFIVEGGAIFVSLLLPGTFLISFFFFIDSFCKVVICLAYVAAFSSDLMW